MNMKRILMAGALAVMTCLPMMAQYVPSEDNLKAREEFEADRFAASCGYADDLIAALDYLADTQDDGEDAKGLFNQLSKTHPDLDTRIARLQEIVNEVLAKNSDLVSTGKQITIENFDGSGYSISFPITAKTMNEYISAKNRIIPELNIELKKNGIEVLR
jgi:hypothetical protein